MSRFDDDVQQRLSLVMQQFSHYNHVATAVEVSQGSYVMWSSKLAKRQQAHVVIEIYY